ncbi:hypothetical protein FNV43_RR10812 [Rhamnella rubrinervis]|uniref:B3 domain-containing protein n=1 Tax=Rhamnella rubrinervis TaxID=2594499 RepID=A0A8K0H4E2_9ROSA|nr:hypothetical protein FNV43_RR10812 [Rhamnella rubrinervis]
MMITTMKKTIYYNFFPTKAEEEAAKSNPKSQPLPRRTPVEIRDVYPQTLPDPNNPWLIRKVLRHEEIQSSKLVLSFNETFEHIFRYWSMDMVSNILKGKRFYVSIWDVSDVSGLARRYKSNDIFLEEEVNNGGEFYYLGWKDLNEARNFNPGDEIGLFWDVNFGVFQFKLLCQKAAL